MIVYLKNKLVMIISWLMTLEIDIRRLFFFQLRPKVVRKQFIRKTDDFPVVSWFYTEKMLYCVDITEDEKIQITKTEIIENN